MPEYSAATSAGVTSRAKPRQCVPDLGGQGVVAATEASINSVDRTAKGIQATSPPVFGRLAVPWAGHGPCIEGAKKKGYPATASNAL
jgi:hypothetical protein